MGVVGALLEFAAHLLNAMPTSPSARRPSFEEPHRLAPTTVRTLAAPILVAATFVAVFASRTTGKTQFHAAIAITGINVIVQLTG